MAEQKFSDFTLETPNLDDSYLAGLHEGDNARFSLAALNTLLQGNIDTVAPLPDGTYAKVMYYTAATGWGASANFVTDGTNVAIGLNNPSAFDSRLTVVDFSGEKDFLLGLIGDGNKSMTFSKYGIASFNTTGANGLGVDEEDYEDMVSARFGLKTFHNQDIVLNHKANGAKLVLGEFNVSDGTYTEEGSLGSDSFGNIVFKADYPAFKNNSSNYNYLVYGDYSGINNLQGAGYFVGWNSPSANKSGVTIGATVVNELPNADVLSSLNIFLGDAVNNCVTVNYGSGSPFEINKTVFKIDLNGKIFMRLPTTAGGNPSGSLVQLWNDGGTLKLS